MNVAKSLVLVLLLGGSSLLLLPSLPKVAHSQAKAGFGDALPDLSSEDLNLFRIAKLDFEEAQEAADGLGPGFNARSCAECHSTPTTGGASAMTVVRFGRLENGQFDPLERLGGSLLQIFALNTECQARIPAEANVIARRLTPPLFGAGLIEGIPDEDIIANAAQQPPELRGRVHWVTDLITQDLRVGRYGWKAQQATLLANSANAYLNEMGVTTRFLPEDRAPNGDAPLLARCDRVPDPEDKFDPSVGIFSVDKFAHFMRLLAPPPRAAKTPEVVQGEQLFNTLDCGVCHKPSFTTGPHDVEALNRKPVNAYSDFLLHNIGTGDNIQQGNAGLGDFRTTPLWGLRARGPYLHDGTAANVEQALLRHGGQAQSARVRFELLSTSQRQALIAFLNSL